MRIRKDTRRILWIAIAFAMISTTVNSQTFFSGPRNMGPLFNSTANELNPVISPSGLSLYFASNRTGGLGAADIYVSHRATLNSPWGPPTLVTALSSIAGDAPGSFSLDGKTMFLQSTRTGGFGGRDIYSSTRTDANDDFGWNAPVNIGGVNTEFDDLAPEYFEDPATGVNSIIFSSDSVGTPGITYRLYQSTRNANGTFNPPTAITELHVGGAEIRAAIRRDGLEIFIAATLPPPQVGFNTYRSTRDSTASPWSAPSLVPGINNPTMDDWVAELSPDGSILYFSVAPPNQSGPGDLYSVTRCSLYGDAPCAVNRAVADFDADGVTDLSIFRPSDGSWWVMNSANGTLSVNQFGAPGDKPVSGDYDGDNRLDLAVFRPSTGDWWILPSLSGAAYAVHWGNSTDSPVPGDYDADGRTDIAVFRNGAWYIQKSSTGLLNYQQFGAAGDIPVPGAQ